MTTLLGRARGQAAVVRPAARADVPEILDLIRELAEFEGARREVEATEDSLCAALFPPSGPPAAHAHVVEAGGALVACAVWFVSFSTWTGRPGLYLEDLVVRGAQRRRGHGRRLLSALADLCVERGYARLEWAVLDWNSSAIAFYRAVGARPMDEWTVHRVSGPALRALASGAAEARRTPAS